MHNKALWYRYFTERTGPRAKRAAAAGRPAPGSAQVPEPHHWRRASRPSVRGLKRARPAR